MAIIITSSEVSYKLYPSRESGPPWARIESSFLQITPLKTQTNLNLSCNIISTTGTRKEAWMLRVLEQPSLFITNSGCTAPIEGTVCTLICQANYQTNITWYVDTKRIQNGVASEPSIGSTNILNITASRRYHNRILRCRAPHPELTEALQTKTVLTVLYPPSIVSGQTSQPLSTTLWCEVDANPPASIIYWIDPQNKHIFSETVTVHKDDSTQGQGNLTRSDLTVNFTKAGSRGVYKCIAYNMIGRAVASVEAKYGPQNTAICVKSLKTCDACRNCTRNASVGEHLELQCIAVGSNPASLLTWEVIGHGGEDLQSVFYRDNVSSIFQDNTTRSWDLENTLSIKVPPGVNAIDVVCRVWYPDNATIFREEVLQILVQPSRDMDSSWKLPAISAGSVASFLLLICLSSLAAVKWRARYRGVHDEMNSGIREETHPMVRLQKQTVQQEDFSVQCPETSVPAISSDFEFPRERVHLEEVIGNGFYGQVLKAKADGILSGEITTVAVKICKGFTGTELKHELTISKALKKHPNVVSFLGSCTDEEPFYLIMEYVPNGTLEAYITKKRVAWTEAKLTTGLMKEAVNPIRILMFAFQIASGMEYLSSMNLVHRDLATRNVLLGEGLTCKLCDFGLARDVTRTGQYKQTSDNTVPFRWMALECLCHNTYTTKSDVWSFGVLLWELVTLGAQPYTDMSLETMVVYLLGGFRLPRPLHCGKEVYNLMSSCWNIEPEMRPDFTDLHQRLGCLLDSDSEMLDMSQFQADKYVYANPLTQTCRPQEN
ncbi:vascular endothelial growth factor receptor 3-like [Acanthaster planci]|uniref:receptor protein-tyrosine kinase n=1 Tax=Acanthaster planci TaxID=133434 RepID=A0A8B7ZN83_ACAPL|nr:vascular endothelial growth factor receptor 3-like [Acanthaster planci]XP_022106354.1 vascular endothelial growth factor receptor 3-like [Acanthaster planci]XP_022106355.1 vascular endothelial growth factor receptor 3-like [Acanthaster planci]XP_022106356.1 vascular endothelial growth factor receptor 3-like [Acanthaster planci]XP_022106358.1 vascular endothelial growth factor receptor 3-like [Acanthaster planci]